MVEYRLAKARVAGSNPVSCSFILACSGKAPQMQLTTAFAALSFFSGAAHIPEGLVCSRYQNPDGRALSSEGMEETGGRRG